MNCKTGSFNVCLESANQFYGGSKWCREREPGDFLDRTLYPYAVNVAFACELYIKAIMILRSAADEFISGHDLKILYDNLSDVDKSGIETAFSKEYSGMTLESFLQENRDVFVEWRYALENNVRINISGFDALLESLYVYVNALS